MPSGARSTNRLIDRFCLTGLGLFGIWLGMSAAWFFAGDIYGFILYRTNWQEECDKAAERNASGAASMLKSPSVEQLRRDDGLSELTKEAADQPDENN